MEKPFSAYRGEDPYVFVCYAHKNDQIVYPEIQWMTRQGVNIWYDEGISAGRIWRSEVGNAIKNASQFILYISEASLASNHCSREINFALDQGIEIIPVYLEEISLTTDLQVGLSSVQALHRDQDPRYRDHLLAALRETAGERERPSPEALTPRKSQVWVSITIIATVMMLSGLVWWYLPFPDTGTGTDVVNIAIEPFVSEAEKSLGLEYEIQRLLVASPDLIVRVSEGPETQSDFLLRGKIIDEDLTAELIDANGETIATWRMALSNKLSLAANTLARDLLVNLGRKVDVIPLLEEQIPQQIFRKYLGAMTMLRGSHSLETLNMALSGLSQVVEDVPRYAPAHAGLCSTYLQLYLEDREESNIQLAEIHCHRALTIGGQDPKVHNALGMLYRETGQEQKSIDNYHRSLELAPYFSDAMRGLADTLVQTGSNAEAENWYREAIKIDPNHWENYHALGIYQFGNGNFDLALEIFQTAFVLAPNEFRILNNIGAASFMVGDYEHAIEYWKQAVKLEPSAPIYANLGTSYFYQREFELAARMYIEAHNEMPNDHRYLGQIAEAHYAGLFGEYDRYFQQAIPLALAQLDINPKDLITVANIASYYAGLGDEENMNLFIERAMNGGSQDPDILYFVTISYARIGDTKIASEMLENLINLGFERKLVKLDANFDELLAIVEQKTPKSKWER